MVDAADSNEPAHRVIGRPFPKGVSGNPSGMPANGEVRHVCRAFMRDKGWQVVQAIALNTKHRECMRANELIAAYAYGRPTILIESSSEELKAFATTLRDLVLASQGQAQQPVIEGEVVVQPTPEDTWVAKMLAEATEKEQAASPERITGAGAIATSPLIGEEQAEVTP